MATKKPKRPLERTLEWARGLGWHVGRVERYTPSFRKNRDGTAAPGGTRHDLFGFADAIALDRKPGCLALQACGQDLAKHVDKLRDNEIVQPWLDAGNRLWIVSWRSIWVKSAKGDTQRRLWKPRIVEAQGYGFFEERKDLAEALAGKEAS